MKATPTPGVPLSEEQSYLKFAGTLLMILGAMQSFLSLAGISVVVFDSSIHFFGAIGIFDISELSTAGWVPRMLIGYILAQVFVGWAIGCLTMRAGYHCLHAKSWHFVYWVMMLNWFCFPAGTTVGLLLWRDLRRESVQELFEHS
ncbi:hypothetical protein [Coraliomargarita parva]|uniref:hypothetical protein n=1 Tax=Coraliomargarita parva TaxID=3014050 RepID=UPI0022B51E60|nr:hypothetical protein [Coraliomargarita parva]